MSGRDPFDTAPRRAVFTVEDERGRTVRWTSAGRAWQLRGHRPEGSPVVDLKLGGADVLRFSLPELRDLSRALDLLVAGAPRVRREASPDQPAAAGRPWVPADDLALAEAFQAGADLAALAARFERTTGAIAARLVRLGLVEDRGTARRAGAGERIEPEGDGGR